MPRRSILLLLYLLTFSTCYSQSKQLEKVLVEFSHFKSLDTDYLIDLKTNNLKYITYPSNDKKEVYQTNSYSYARADLTDLLDKLQNNIPIGTVRKGEDGLDGGGFVFTFYLDDASESKLIVKNPTWKGEKYKTELEILNAFFDFLYSVIKDSTGVEMLDMNYNWYHRGLPIRKVSDNPLEYKIWGTINMNMSYQPAFLNFLNNLPKDRCVIIDTAENLSYSLQDDILKMYIIKGSNLKFANMTYLKHTREYLFEVKNYIEKFKQENPGLEVPPQNTFTYQLYMSDPDGLNNWLTWPDDQWNVSYDNLKKQCK